MATYHRTLTAFFILAVFTVFASPAAAEEQKQDVDTSEVRAESTAVGQLVQVPVAVVKINDFIYWASGLSNVYLVTTPEGNVLIDTGFAFMAPKQAALLKQVNDGPVTHIVLPQGQHDDMGGLSLWREPNTKIVMTRSSAEYMHWRKKMDRFLLHRFTLLYPWAKQLVDGEKVRFPYEVIEPDILVEEHEGYAFEVGGRRFEIIALPGAEGINSAGVWLPDHKILFAGGGFVGPVFPMWPNIGTVRGDTNRLVDAYITSLNRVIALEPEIFLPGQDRPVSGKQEVLARLTRIRDAVTHVRDAVVKGMNEGKDVYQLMQEVTLPKEVADLDQTHGRVDWTVRSMVYHYGAWFQYRRTTELYPHHISEVFPDLVDLAGGADKLIAQARKRLGAGQPVHAMFLVEVAMEKAPGDRAVLEAQLETLTALLKRARETTNTFSEIAWLQSQIAEVQAQLGNPGESPASTH